MKKSKTGALVGAPVAVVLLAGGGIYYFSAQESPVTVETRQGTASGPVNDAVTPVPQSESATSAASAPATPPAPQFAPLPPPPTPFSSSANRPAQSTPPVLVVSPAFRAWTDDARISGVVSGASPRAIINGRLVRPGDVVDATLGIAFDGVDAERKLVVFRNRDGVFTTKTY